MLREHINEIMIRWSPKERRGAAYDPIRFLETPEQARKLILHLEQELSRARYYNNLELVCELQDILGRVQGLAKRFFRWEQNVVRAQHNEELREIRRLPLNF